MANVEEWETWYTFCPLGHKCSKGSKYMHRCWSRDQAAKSVINHLMVSTYHNMTEEEAEDAVQQDDGRVKGPYLEKSEPEVSSNEKKRHRSPSAQPSKRLSTAPKSQSKHVALKPQHPKHPPATSTSSDAVPENTLSRIQAEYDWQAADRIKAAYSFCQARVCKSSYLLRTCLFFWFVHDRDPVVPLFICTCV